MTAVPPLTRMVHWAHTLLAPVLRPGDLAVDLTAGNGADTLFLARRVGPQGRVLAFDLQQQALQATATRLVGAGVAVQRWQPGPLSPGVHLVHDSHEHVAAYLDGQVQGMIANLGFLPGGDRQLTTAAASTVAALRHGLDHLAVGGRLAVVCYRDHPGGHQEGEAVDGLLSALPVAGWQVLRLDTANDRRAPRLLVVERRHGARRPAEGILAP
jgi:hypothetical protein